MVCLLYTSLLVINCGLYLPLFMVIIRELQCSLSISWLHLVPAISSTSVSYTHLDMYKRQTPLFPSNFPCSMDCEYYPCTSCSLFLPMFPVVIFNYCEKLLKHQEIRWRKRCNKGCAGEVAFVFSVKPTLYQCDQHYVSSACYYLPGITPVSYTHLPISRHSAQIFIPSP